MRYQESREQSAEILRLTLPLMSLQQACFHPQTYTLWYEHCAGTNPRLSQVLDSKLAANAALSNDDVWQLYAQYVVAREAGTVELIQQQLCDLIDKTGHASALAGEEATHFTQTLTLQRDQLQKPLALEAVRTILSDLIVDTERMRTTTLELAERLESSVVEVRSLRERLEKAEHEATLDPLTGLLNRRGLIRSAQTISESAMLLIDIDHFKDVNDKYGHLVGDKVITMVAQVLRANIKGRDLAARLGGDEFAIFLPATGVKGASSLAQQIRIAVAALAIRRNDQATPPGKVTLSMGISESRMDGTLEQMIQDADKALYGAKNAGRNHVQVFPV
jgi:diguanylate cyclase